VESVRFSVCSYETDVFSLDRGLSSIANSELLREC